MTVHVLAELTRLVAEHGAVPVWVHAPSAPPALVTAEHSELAGLSIGPYIRLAMSNSREHGDARIAFEVAVCELTQQYGLGVHLSEGRAGLQLRTWNPVITFDEPLYRTRRAAQFDAPPTRIPTEQVMLTLVGPSTGRSTAHLHELGQIVGGLGIGLHAAAAWQVHQTNFVHLIMPRTAVGPLSGDPHTLDADTVIGFLATECGTAPERARRAATPAVAGRAARRPGRHGGVAATPRRPHRGAVLGGVGPARGADRRRPARRLPDGRVRAAGRVPRRGRHEWVTYLNARRTGRDRWRGQAKVSVDVPDRWIRGRDTAAMGTMAKRVQECVVNAILDEHHLPVHAVQLHVAWGERWLGRPVDW